jgi:hypothetical protein
MKETHFKVLSVIVFFLVLFAIYGGASTSTRGGYIFEKVNQKEKVETRAHKRAVKKWETAVKNRKFRGEYYPEWLVKMQDQSNPVGPKP